MKRNNNNHPNNSDLHPVFVYGSLLSGLSNHGCLRGARFVAQATTAEAYEMHSLGGFPGLLLNDNAPHASQIVGEVWRVDDVILARLDRLEGFPQFYNRTEIAVDLDTGERVNALVYHLNVGDRITHGHRNVPDGCWRTYIKNERTWA